MPLVTVETVARMIDHSLLNPALTDAEMEAGLALARRHGVASVCIKPYYVTRAVEVLDGTLVEAGTVVGFPHGGHATAVKVFEAEKAIREGAGELDIVVNIGKVLSGDWGYVENDLNEVLKICKRGRALSKVIFENCYLNDDQKIHLCKMCEALGADFVKTSTGYGACGTGGSLTVPRIGAPGQGANPGAFGGATDADLKLMRENVTQKVQVKAAGGVRTFARLVEVMCLGVARVGATATEAILAEAAQVLGPGMEAEELYARVTARPSPVDGTY